MVGDIFQPTHLLFVLVVALLVLGPKRLPEVGRTLGSGIRDFRQALSGDSSDPPQRYDSEQVATTTSDLHHPPETTADEDITWPEEAVGPTSYDEPVEAATAEPATAVVTDAEPATELVSESEPSTAVFTDHEPAAASSANEANEADAPRMSELDALYFYAPPSGSTPIADSSDSSESHTEQSS